MQGVIAGSVTAGVDFPNSIDIGDFTEQIRWKISLWDALILSAARAAGATELITEDLNHGQDYGGVQVINPFR